MNSLLLRGGQLVGAVGVLLMTVAVIVRLGGRYTLSGYETGTLLLGGIGAVVVGCFLLLWTLSERKAP